MSLRKNHGSFMTRVKCHFTWTTRISHFQRPDHFLWYRTDSAKSGSWGCFCIVTRADFDHVRFFRKKYFFPSKPQRLDCTGISLPENGTIYRLNSWHRIFLLPSTWPPGRYRVFATEKSNFLILRFFKISVRVTSNGCTGIFYCSNVPRNTNNLSAAEKHFSFSSIWLRLLSCFCTFCPIIALFEVTSRQNCHNFRNIRVLNTLSRCKASRRSLEAICKLLQRFRNFFNFFKLLCLRKPQKKAENEVFFARCRG